MGWRATSAVAGVALLAGAGGTWWLTRDREAPPPAKTDPGLADRPDGPQAELAVLALAVRASVDQNAEMLRLMQRRQDPQGVVIRDDGQAAAMAALLRDLVNDRRRERGEAEISAAATPAEIAAALAAQGGRVLPERVVQSPCRTKGRMHGVVPSAGDDWELIPEWDPCPPETPKRPWLNASDWTIGTRHYAILGAGAWGNANLSLGDSLAAASLSIDSTQIGWTAGGGLSRLFVSPSGRWLHEFGFEARYRSSTALDGWEIAATFKPGWFRPADRD